MAREREGGRRQLDSPLGLLALGYAMAAVGAFVVAMIGGGLAALLLTFWLGGALATLFCALVWVLLELESQRELPRFGDEETPGFEAVAGFAQQGPARILMLPTR